MAVCSRWGPPRSRDGTYPRRVGPRSRSNDLTTDTPCHTPCFPSSRRFDPKCQGPFPHTAHQPPWLSRPGATSTDGSHPPHPLLALRVRLRGRHCCLGFAASAQLPVTRSPASLRVRSSRLAGYSPERRGHVPSIDFCNCMNSQARPRMPKPRRMNAVASHRTVGGVVLARRHQLSSHSPGFARPTKEACDTAATSVTPLRFVPNLSYLRHPLSLTSTRRRLEQATVGGHTDPDARRRRAWPLPAPTCLHIGRLDGRTSSPGSRRRNIARLVGPPPVGARESTDSQLHPGCLPPSRPATPFGSHQQDALAAMVSHRWSDALDTFVTGTAGDLDKVANTTGSAAPR